MTIEELKEILHARYPDVEVLRIEYSDLVFEERVKLKCSHCLNYSAKWTCPGKMPVLDYSKIISEYANRAVVICKVPLHGGAGGRCVAKTLTGERSETETGEIDCNGVMNTFREGVVRLHKAMLYLEGELFKRNNAMAESFIGCSCQLCEEGCATDKCRHPEQARVPWDATGCNVVKTLERIGVKVEFPAKDCICQYGLFLW